MSEKKGSIDISSDPTTTGHLTVSDGSAFRVGGPFVQYRMAYRPETTEDALALCQAFYDAGKANGVEGFVFHAPEDRCGALDQNPLLDRMP